MSKPEFTPGPWENWSNGYVRHHNAKDRAGRTRAYVLCTVNQPSSNEIFASVGTYDHGGAKAIQEANARLIAAAPALYEALRRCSAMLHQESCEHGYQDADVTYPPEPDTCLNCHVNAALALVV